MTSQGERMWRCTVCGYMHRGDEPPEFCPSCAAAASEFEAVEETQTAAAEDDWRDVGAVEELSGQPLRRIEIGDTALALVWKNGEFTAISGTCNHVGGPLAEGWLDGDHVVCPWHDWKFHRCTGRRDCDCAEEQVPTYAVKVENGRVLVNLQETTPRKRRARPSHPLTHIVLRGQPGGPALTDPLRVVGISTTNMDVSNPRPSTSDLLLDAALSHAQDKGAQTRRIRLAELVFKTCEGYYSRSARACIWPCYITQRDPDDQMKIIYEAFVQWGDIILVATPIRWGQASSLYYRMVERMNCIQNQETIANRHLLRTKVVGLIITGGQDNIQSVAGQMLAFFGELGCQFPQYPFIAHSRGWSAEDMENNVKHVGESRELRKAAAGLVDRCLDTCRALLGVRIGEDLLPRGGRKAHELDVPPHP